MRALSRIFQGYRENSIESKAQTKDEGVDSRETMCERRRGSETKEINRLSAFKRRVAWCKSGAKCMNEFVRRYSENNTRNSIRD